jgi:hypothetical protein
MLTHGIKLVTTNEGYITLLMNLIDCDLSTRRANKPNVHFVWTQQNPRFVPIVSITKH